LNAWSKGHPLIKHSRIGRRRAAVLILVYVLMAAHLVQWLITGLTVSPVEPSESMYTLRDGAVNAGFVFFVVAILSTLVFGRFFCGWGCHVVAVQDLCAWIMMKVGVKPRPFRSRLLMLVPVGLAFYMFAWPVMVREVVRPLLADSRGHLPDWMGQIDPLPGYRAAFLVQDFWATFATWYVAIPFMLVCGAVAVYFLGAKAFCTYGCPYGGIFGPVDLASPGKIVVNDNCEHCGHCTAVCTSNVRVHEEVRDFGMVVDPGCMKCMDCVSVCPNDALSFGFAKPALFVKPREGAEKTAAKAKALRAARWDLNWPEEIACLAIFVVLFLCYRGMFNQVPMLMAVAMAGLGAWACWKTWRLLRDANSRVHGFQLKMKGRVRAWGAVFAMVTVACMVVAAWSGYVRWNLLRAQIAYQRLDTPTELVLQPEFAPTTEDLARSRAALAFYEKAAPPGEVGRAGLGYLWPLRPEEWLNVGYLRLLSGDWDGAEAAMQRIIEKGHPKDELVFQLARIKHARTEKLVERMGYQGMPEQETSKVRAASEERIEAMLADALARHDDLFGVRDHILRRMIESAGKPEPGDAANAAEGRVRAAFAAANAEWDAAIGRHPRSARARIIAAALAKDHAQGAGARGRADEAQKDVARARSLVESALAQPGITPDEYLMAAGVMQGLGESQRAAEIALKGADAAQRVSGPRLAAARLLAQMGMADRAVQETWRAVEQARARPRAQGEAGTIVGAGILLITMDLSIEAELAKLPAERLAARAKELNVPIEGVGPKEIAAAILKRERERLRLDGLPLVKEGAALLGSEWDLGPVGLQLAQMGMQSHRAELSAEGVKLLERARDANPQSAPLHHDLAVACYMAKRPEDAMREIRKAAELAPNSAYLAERASKLYEEAGKIAESQYWGSEAHRRGESGGGGPVAPPP
jgi:polyferredoxin/tetratricopeptide (TPR) repeat protein